jgi:hypothetical protein
MDPEDPAFVAFFDGLIDGSLTPKIHDLITPLVDPRLEPDPAKPQHELLWSLLKPIFGVIDAAEGGPLDEAHRKELEGKTPEEQEKIREEWKRELARMRQFGFYTIAAAQPFGILEGFLGTMGPILSHYRGYLIRHADVVGDLLRSKSSSYLIRALFEDRDPVARERLLCVLRAFLDNPQNGLDLMGALQSVDEDEPLKMEEISGPIWDFFKEKNATSEERATARRLREYVAERLEQGHLDELLLLGRRAPDGFHGVLEVVARHTVDGDLKDFADMTYRAVMEPVGVAAVAPGGWFEAGARAKFW